MSILVLHDFVYFHASLPATKIKCEKSILVITEETTQWSVIFPYNNFSNSC